MVDNTDNRANSDCSMATLALSVRRRGLVSRVLWAILTVEVLLYVLDAVFYQARLIRIGSLRYAFNLADDSSLGTWVSSMVFLMSAGTLWLIGRYAAQVGERRKSWGWTGLASFFLYLSIDDTARFHERVGWTVRDFVKDTAADDGFNILRWLSGTFPSHEWQLVYMPILALIALFMIVFLWIECSELRLRLQICCFFGLCALGECLEYVEGLADGKGHRMLVNLVPRDTEAVVHYASSTEELLEAAGPAILLAALMQHLINKLTAVSLTVEGDDDGS